jgi:uncharacterized protein (TIGR03435 family)
MTGAMKLKLVSVALAITVAFAGAQTESSNRPEFEVASIKPSKPGTRTTFGVGNGGASEANVSLKALMAFAYRLQEYQILGGPSWVGSDRFDIEARAADRKADPDQLRLMLQSLFADRFKLALHRETKPSNVFALVVAKNGPKIKLSTDQFSPDANGPSPPGSGPGHGVIRMTFGNIIGNAVSISHFVSLLSQRLDRPVVDKTSLTGRFDIRLRWTPDVGENPLSPSGDPLPQAPTDPSAPSIFAAIQEQLGLKLEAAKGRVEFLVIDHVERPSEN